MPYFMASYETGGISHQAVGQFRIPYGWIDGTGLYKLSGWYGGLSYSF